MPVVCNEGRRRTPSLQIAGNRHAVGHQVPSAGKSLLLATSILPLSGNGSCLTSNLPALSLICLYQIGSTLSSQAVNGQDIINVAVNGNFGDQIDYGLELNAEADAGTFSGKIMYAANNFDSSVGDYRNTGTAAVIPIIGFNGGTFGAQLFTGSGTPEGVVTARTGSMYLNSVGGDSTTVYYKESGAGNTGWVAIGGDVLAFGVGTPLTVAIANDAVAPAGRLMAPATEWSRARDLPQDCQPAAAGWTRQIYDLRIFNVKDYGAIGE